MQLVVQASDKPYACTLDRPATYTRHSQHFIFAFYQSMHVKSQHTNKTLALRDP